MTSGDSSRGRNAIASGFRRFRELCRRLIADRPLVLAFGLIVLIDLAWIAWFAVAESAVEAGSESTWHNLELLHITSDRSIPEIFNYLKLIVVIVLLERLFERHRQWIYAALGIAFAIILLDDALQIHETCGEYFVELFDIPYMWGMRDHDIGELITWAIIGHLVVPIVLVAFIKSSREHRANGMALMVPVAGLLFAAVFVDQLYLSNRNRFPGAGIVIDSVEDGGEMLAITLLCALVAVLVRSSPDRNASTPGDQPTPARVAG